MVIQLRRYDTDTEETQKPTTGEGYSVIRDGNGTPTAQSYRLQLQIRRPYKRHATV